MNDKNIPVIQINISDVEKYHKNPDELIKKIQNQVGNVVFDVTTNKGRDECRSHSTNVIRCITPALNASKAMAADAKKVQESDLNFRKIFEKGIREIADNIRNPLTEWEDEQERMKSEIEAKKQYDDDFSAALIENELFYLRKEKADREEKEYEESKAIEKAEYERKLQERAEERIAEEMRQMAENQRLELEMAENQRLEAIQRAERAEYEKTKAIEKAESDAKAREQAAIIREREAQKEKARLEAENIARLEKEETVRAKNKEHRRKVNLDIIEKLALIGINEDKAKVIITAAVKVSLGAMVINYSSTK